MPGRELASLKLPHSGALVRILDTSCGDQIIYAWLYDCADVFDDPVTMDGGVEHAVMHNAASASTLIQQKWRTSSPPRWVDGGPSPMRTVGDFLPLSARPTLDRNFTVWGL